MFNVRGLEKRAIILRLSVLTTTKLALEQYSVCHCWLPFQTCEVSFPTGWLLLYLFILFYFFCFFFFWMIQTLCVGREDWAIQKLKCTVNNACLSIDNRCIDTILVVSGCHTNCGASKQHTKKKMVLRMPIRWFRKSNFAIQSIRIWLCSLNG